MLRATHGLLKPGGRIGYYTILIAPGLSERDYKRASLIGPPAVAGRREQKELLETAGFVDVEETDVTPAYLETARAWLEQRALHEDELRRVYGEEEFAQKEIDSETTLVAIEAGLLRRSLLTAKRTARAAAQATAWAT